MKKILFISICFISISLFSSELNVIKVVYSPKDFYVGDMVSMHIYVETPFEGALESPKIIPEADWIDIKSGNVMESGPEQSVLRVSFTSFSPGLKVLPDIVFGDYTLHGLKVQTLSILGDQFSELQPLSPQMVPPGTNLIVVLVIIGLIFGPYVGFILIRTIFSSLKLAIKKYKREKPFRDYLKTLKGLKGELEDDSVRNFYVIIIEQLKVYLSVRFSKEFSSATTREMSKLLYTIMDSDTSEELLSICRFADLVKFSHTNASTLHRGKDLRTIVDILYQLEGKDRGHARF